MTVGVLRWVFDKIMSRNSLLFGTGIGKAYSLVGAVVYRLLNVRQPTRSNLLKVVQRHLSTSTLAKGENSASCGFCISVVGQGKLLGCLTLAALLLPFEPERKARLSDEDKKCAALATVTKTVQNKIVEKNGAHRLDGLTSATWRFCPGQCKFQYTTKL